MWRRFSRSARVRAGLRRVGLAVVWPAWTYTAVFVLGGLLGGLLVYMSASQLGIELDDSPLTMMVLSVVIYAVGLTVLLIEPYAVRRMTMATIAKLLGIYRRPRWHDSGVMIVGWAGYLTLALAVMAAIASYLPTVDLTQHQQIGFTTDGSMWDKLYAFVVIVIAAPIVEETVFRGYLQGNLRRTMPWWLGALITSSLFGYVHGQWNVGIDTFIMSMVACYLREQTGAIWSGIGLHMMKNSIAYYLLFFAPPWVVKLLGG